MAATMSACSLSVPATATCGPIASGKVSVRRTVCMASNFQKSSGAFATRPAESSRRSLPVVQAVQEEVSTQELNAQTQKFIAEAQAKWDKVEDKTTVIVYAVGSFAAIWLSSVILGAFDSLPIVPKIFELVGVGYTGYFVYRYLLFTPNRQELKLKIKEITAKITGDKTTTLE